MSSITKGLVSATIATLLLLGSSPLIAAPAKNGKPARPVARASAMIDWTRKVTPMPSGGFLLGNPNARHRIVEYFSYSCPHCADFAKESTAELKNRWIKPGLLAIEYRSYLLNGFDIPASLLARCGGATRFLAAHEAIYGNYDAWIKSVQTYANADDSARPKDRGALFTDIADKTGLTAIIAKTGSAPAALHQCLADKVAHSEVTKISAAAWDADPNFEGTPTFLIDGKVASGIHSWAGLRPLLLALPGSGN